jgi:3-deoxy-manno-octulosonate cytidylyltransferase (CMP-KDO synthetase)
MSTGVVIIPARLGSSRLPGKLLADLDGKPVLQWVYERACLGAHAKAVYVATGDPQIVEACAGFDAPVLPTAREQRSGTDRVAEAAKRISARWVVNLQGDEPFLDPKVIDLMFDGLSAGAAMVTASTGLSADEYDDPSAIKVVTDEDNHAVFFSRAPIPFTRDAQQRADLARSRFIGRHLGIYGYTAETLQLLAGAATSDLEATEQLEQLRALHLGIRIRVVRVPNGARAIDTPADLDAARTLTTTQYRRASRR